MLLWLSISLLSCKEDSVNQVASLQGHWQFLGFADNQGKLVEPEPNNQPKPVTIQFTPDTVTGEFGFNYLSAHYRILADSILIVSDLNYTEAVGTPWEMKFMDNFPRDTTRYLIEADTLILLPISSSNRTPSTDNMPTVYQRMDK